MGHLARHLPLLAALAYTAGGLGLGFSRWAHDGVPLVATVAVVLGTLWSAAGAREATSPGLRRRLLALVLLLPVAFLPHPFQPLTELTALRLLVVAVALDAVWALSGTPAGVPPRWRLAWLTLCYGGALLMAVLLTMTTLPWHTAPLLWGLVAAALAGGSSLRRLIDPSELLQEVAAHHALWILATTGAAAALLFAVAPNHGELLWSVASATAARGLTSAAVRLAQRDTSFSTRAAVATPLVAAALAGLAFLAGLEGTEWTTAVVTTLLLGTALLAEPARRLLGGWLAQLPPRSPRLLREAVKAVTETLGRQPDLETIATSLSPLQRALPTGAVALTSFDPDRTLLVREDGHELRASGPGEPLRQLLLLSASARPIFAARVVDRSVRDTTLRPAADLIDEVGAELVIPLPGGEDESLAGALLVGRPVSGFLRGQTGATLQGLAERLGPQLRAAMLLERAGERIGELEEQRSLAEDRLEHLEFRLERLVEENRLLRADRAGTRPAEVVGRSPAMRSLLTELERAARLDTGLLIRGEAGSGRTLVARLLHQASARREAPLVQLNCSVTDPAQHLTTLLGQVGGATPKPGLIELADQGTLLLEEIGALALEAQAELIRVLASGEVSRAAAEPDGVPSQRHVDVRIVGTTGRSSEQALATDTLLPEVSERLGLVTLSVPPLRDRRGDIAELAQLFLERTARRYALDLRGWSAEALALLEAAPWPGNVRQLRAVVEQAALTAKGRRLVPADLPPLGQPQAQPLPKPAGPTPDFLEGTYDEIEREILRHALAQSGGNKAEAARRLGLKRTTLNSRLRKYEIG